MHYKHAALLLITASMASCVESEKDGPIYGEGLSFIATNAGSPDSKSYFGPGGETLYWSAYDNIGVYDYTSHPQALKSAERSANSLRETGQAPPSPTEGSGLGQAQLPEITISMHTIRNKAI